MRTPWSCRLISRRSGGGPAKIGDPVYRGDVVQTGANGKVGITFTDGTAFNLSSNGRMVLNEFVYDPNGTSNSTLFSLTKGTFTFVAGKVATGYEDRHSCRDHEGSRHHAHAGISGDGTVRFANLIEENKAQVTEKLEQNKRGAPGKRLIHRRGNRPKARTRHQLQAFPGVLNRLRSWPSGVTPRPLIRAFNFKQSSVRLFSSLCLLLMWSHAATELEMKDRARRGGFCAGTSALVLLWLGELARHRDPAV